MLIKECTLRRICCELTTATALLAFEPAIAADGDIDATFGVGGFATTGETGAGYLYPPKPVVQVDSKIVLCSPVASGGASGEDFLVARFNVDGTLDNTFSFDGKVNVDFDGNNDYCAGIALQSDGKIVLAGTTVEDAAIDFAVARLNADGTLDATFGAGTGRARIAFDLGDTDRDLGGAVAVQSDGKIVVAGYADTEMDGNDFAIVRLLPDGTRDPAFNLTGRVTVGFDFVTSLYRNDQAFSVQADSAGRIVVGGIAEKDASSPDFAVVRLLPNGDLDPDFSADGRATIAFDLGASGFDASFQTILQRDGRIVMVGAVDTSGSGTPAYDMGVARLLQDGSPDASFGIGGKTTIPFDLVSDANDIARGVVQDSAGRLVVAGGAVYDENLDFRGAIARLDSSGNLDDSFGVSGKKTFDFGALGVEFLGAALQGTQIIVSGNLSTATEGDNVVARLLVDLIFAGGFE